jgi:hypothetical protein
MPISTYTSDQTVEAQPGPESQGQPNIGYPAHTRPGGTRSSAVDCTMQSSLTHETRLNISDRQMTDDDLVSSLAGGLVRETNHAPSVNAIRRMKLNSHINDRQTTAKTNSNSRGICKKCTLASASLNPLQHKRQKSEYFSLQERDKPNIPTLSHQRQKSAALYTDVVDCSALLDITI